MGIRGTAAARPVRLLLTARAAAIALISQPLFQALVPLAVIGSTADLPPLPLVFDAAAAVFWLIRCLGNDI
jgi:hypothetical protein